MERLKPALARGPLVIVTGAEGIGKTELVGAAAELAVLAASFPSERLAREASFFGVLDPPALEALAAAEGVVAVAARRAQALLGGWRRLDRIDRRVVDAYGAPRVELAASCNQR